MLLKAFGVSAASQGTMNNIVFGNDEFGFYETLGGGSGATSNQSGASAVHTHMTNTRLTDAEIIEKNYPVRIVDFSVRKNSGGDGENSGGDGLIRTYEFQDDIELSIISQRRKKSPYGLSGGSSGDPGVNFLKKKGHKNWQEIEPVCHLSCSAGDQLRILTPGGGGFGDTLS